MPRHRCPSHFFPTPCFYQKEFFIINASAAAQSVLQSKPAVAACITIEGKCMTLELSDYLIAALVLVMLAFWIDRWWRK
jgi:hypothetical protein